ncbi:hypothetical protein [Alteribacillus sp. HJP-4]|uniref:hypothetical protein n=1 Tax=Alteribacillus sp. HJP-4 TaxID=2775394 RepID=UPI0035CCCAB5
MSFLKKIGPYVFLLSLVLFMYFFKTDQELTNQEINSIENALERTNIVSDYESE